MKPYCHQCDRHMDRRFSDVCRIPVERDLWSQHVPWTLVDCAKQNANNDCQYWTPKRSLLTKIENALFWGGK